MNAKNKWFTPVIIVVALVLILIGALVLLWPDFKSAELVAAEDLAGDQIESYVLAPAVYRQEEVVQVAIDEEDEGEAVASLSGKVISRIDGAPISGAILSFSLKEKKFNIKSRADGSFYFIAHSEGLYTLEKVSAADFQTKWMPLGNGSSHFEAKAGLDVSDIIITLDPAHTLEGLVVNQAREAVGGAEVWYMPFKDPHAGFSVKCDESGHFTITVPDHSVLEARMNGYLPGRNFVRLDNLNGGPLVIVLGDEVADDEIGNIAGQVVDPDGGAVAGAMITAFYNSDEGMANGRLRRFPNQVYSDENGNFELSGLRAGDYHVSATADNYQPATANVVTGAAEVKLVLQAGFTLKGRVTDQETGAPLQSYSVLLTRLGSRAMTRSVPVYSVDGTYEIKGLNRQTFNVSIAAQGYASSDVKTMVPTEGQELVADFELIGGGRVYGQIVDEETGEPIGGAILRSEGRMMLNGAGNYHSRSTSDNNGNFEFYGLAIGTRSLVVNARGYNEKLVTGLEINPGGSIGPLKVELSAVAPGERPHQDLTGIGAVLGARNDYVVVMSVVPGGGAAEVGLSIGDKILEVDGTDARNRNFTDVVEAVRGPEGSSVSIKVQKADGSEMTYQVPRRRVRT